MPQEGNFREPLNLDGIMSDFNRRWEGSSTAGQKVNYAKAWWEQEPGAEEAERAREAAQRARQQQLDEPYKVGTGPVECSTSTVLAILPEICWDVNGYYRTLGVHWKATRKQLMMAFHEFGPKPTAYQMHCLKQVLNPAIRRAYDLSPLGEPFLDDHYVQDALKKKAAEEARRRTVGGHFTTAEEVIKEQFDFHPENPGDTPDETVDMAPPDQQGDDEQELSDPPETVWPYAHYLWRSKLGDATERMAQWQGLLVTEIAKTREVIRLAVGSAGRMAHPYVIGQVGNQFVVFLNDNTAPSEDVTSSAVVALLRTLHETSDQPAKKPQENKP